MSILPPPATRIAIAIGILFPCTSAWAVIDLDAISRRSGLTTGAIEAVARECPGAVELALPAHLELSEDQEFPGYVSVRRRERVAR